ncbi:hypothetical protein AWENTII_010789 [Aspergillus wentii]
MNAPLQVEQNIYHWLNTRVFHRYVMFDDELVKSHVYNSIGGHLYRDTLPARQPPFQHIIPPRDSAVQAQIIIITSPVVCPVFLCEALGRHFQTPVDFFISHFFFLWDSDQDAYQNSETPLHIRQKLLRRMIRLGCIQTGGQKHRFISICVGSLGVISIFIIEGKQNTVIILCDPCSVGSTRTNTAHEMDVDEIHATFCDTLDYLTTEEIDSADRAPCEYALQYLRIVAADVYSWMIFPSPSKKHKQTSDPDVALKDLETIQQVLHEIKGNLVQFQPESASVRRFLTQIKCWEDECHQRIQDSRYLSEATIRDALRIDSQKSIEHAVSVKRLSILATVFLPLNLATSFFGMNAAQLGSGPVQIWVFIVVAATASTLTFVVPFVMLHLKNSVRASRTLRAVSRVAGHSYGDAFWLFIFYISHGTDTSDIQVQYIQFDGGDWEEDIAALEKKLMARLDLFPEFWIRRAHRIYELGYAKE